MIELKDDKQQISSDLDSLAYLLNYYGLCKDTRPIYDAVGQCNHYSTEQSWSYSINNLCFDLSGHSHTLPTDAGFIQVLFSIQITGNYSSVEICVPATDLELNIELRGYNQAMSDLHSSWHLDKHIHQEGDGQNKFYHPEYHMSFGGRKMWDSGYDYGAMLLLPAPRLVHPPLDGILGVDFVVHNYIRYNTHKEMTESTEYIDIIKRAQARLWKPFFISLASVWYPEINIDTSIFPPHKIIPNIQL